MVKSEVDSATFVVIEDRKLKLNSKLETPATLCDGLKVRRPFSLQLERA